MKSTTGKDNQNWQNISQLPLMSVQLHKMHRDTLDKLDLLKNNLESPYAILDVDVARIMHVLHRQLKNYSILLEQLSIWKNETRKPDEIELIDAASTLCHEINSFTVKCQELAEEVKNITVEAKSQIPKYDREAKESIFKWVLTTFLRKCNIRKNTRFHKAFRTLF